MILIAIFFLWMLMLNLFLQILNWTLNCFKYKDISKQYKLKLKSKQKSKQ